MEPFKSNVTLEFCPKKLLYTPSPFNVINRQFFPIYWPKFCYSQKIGATRWFSRAVTQCQTPSFPRRASTHGRLSPCAWRILWAAPNTFQDNMRIFGIAIVAGLISMGSEHAKGFGGSEPDDTATCYWHDCSELRVLWRIVLTNQLQLKLLDIALWTPD